MTKAALFDEEGREVAAVSARSETSAARAIRNVFTVATQTARMWPRSV